VVQQRDQQIRRVVSALEQRPPGVVLRPKTKQFTLIDTCYSTHHLQFDHGR